MPRDVRISEELPRDQIPPAADVEMAGDGLKKMLGVIVSVRVYKLVRDQAIRSKTPISEMLRRELKPLFTRLRTAEREREREKREANDGHD